MARLSDWMGAMAGLGEGAWPDCPLDPLLWKRTPFTRSMKMQKLDARQDE